MEQLVARWAHNPKVAGSSPAPATRKESHYRKIVAFLRFRHIQLFKQMSSWANNPKIVGSTGQAILASSRYKRSLSKDGGLFAFLEIMVIITIVYH